MPELPEVETVKNGIAKFIGNAKIIDVEIRNYGFRQRIANDFAEKIRQRQITGYRRTGKYIIIRLDNNGNIILHLGMSGRIKTFARIPQTFEKHDHVIIHTSNGYLVFNDPRRFGLLLYAEDGDLPSLPCFVRIGIDPFDKALTANYLYAHLQKRAIPIKTALLEQGLIAGIGNIYASEILYQSRISPLRPANRITLREAETLIANTRVVLQKAIDNGGSTLHDYHKPDGSLGYFQNLHCVYNKTGKRCPDCTCKTGAIVKITQNGRSTYYCPEIQK